MKKAATAHETRRPHSGRVRPFDERFREAVDRLVSLGRTRHDIAGYLRIEHNTLEMWLAGRAKSWGREPPYLSQVGALALLTVHAAGARRAPGDRHRPTAARAAKLRARALDLLQSGETVSATAGALGISVTTVYRWRRESAPATDQ